MFDSNYSLTGLAGFQQRSSVRTQASKILTTSLPLTPYGSERNFLFLLNKHNLNIIQAIMDGDWPDIDLYCD